jgi:hypothetical protein
MVKISLLLCIFSFYLLQAQNTIVNPPGTLKLNDSLYIDKAPVTNFMFIVYLDEKEELKEKGYSTLSEYHTDTIQSGFPKEMSNSILLPSPFLIEFYSENKYLGRKGYGKKQEFRNHPVLTITKARASDYCAWRTEKVRYLWLNDPKYAANKVQAERIAYRLPTKNELISAKTYFTSINKAIMYRRRLFRIIDEKVPTDFYVFPIDELTASEEIFNEDPTHDYTGFRCVCELKK